MAGRRHSGDLTERPLNEAEQPATRQGSLWIVEPRFSAGGPSTAPDPQQPVDPPMSRHLVAKLRTLNAID
jgi:hypothetical protein